jgi:hypothetical protein
VPEAELLAGVRDTLRWTEMAYEATDPGDDDARARAAGLSALPAAEVALLLGDGDPDLSGALDLAARRLAEARRHAPTAASLGYRLPLAAGQVRWRSATLNESAPAPEAVEAVVTDLTAALGKPWHEPVTPGEPRARWSLAGALLSRGRAGRRAEDLAAASAHTLEAMAATRPDVGAPTAPADTERLRRQVGLLWQKSGENAIQVVNADIDKVQLRARALLTELPLGHSVRPILRTLSVTGVLTEVLRTQRWSPEGDRALTELRAVPEEWGNSGSAAERRVARAFALQFGCLRLRTMMMDHGTQIAADGLDELDDLEAELVALSAERDSGVGLRDGLASTIEGSVTLARLLIGAALAFRVSLHVAADRERTEQDVADLARSEQYFSRTPPQMQAELAQIRQLLKTLGGPNGFEETTIVQPLKDLAPEAPDIADALGGRIGEVVLRVKEAVDSRDCRDVAAAVDLAQEALRTLPATHPARAELLGLTSQMLSVQAIMTGSVTGAAAALDAAVNAAQIASILDDANSRQILDAVVVGLIGAVGQGAQHGPFSAGANALEIGLAERTYADDAQRLRWLVGLGAGLALQWPALNPAGRDHARDVLARAERLFVESPPQTEIVAAGLPLFLVLAHVGIPMGDQDCQTAAGRVLEHVDGLLAGASRIGDDLASRLPALPLPGMPPGFSGPTDGAGLRAALATLRQMFGGLRAAPPMPPPPTAGEVQLRVRSALRVAAAALVSGTVTESDDAAGLLTGVLAAGLTDPRQREAVESALGRCLARSAGVSRSSATGVDGLDLHGLAKLSAAVRHLEQVTANPTDPFPSADRAGLLDLLACCHRVRADGLPEGERAAARERALDLVRAALREWLGAVLLAEQTDTALVIAAQANAVVARSISWCLADDRPDLAVTIAENGRSLVLSSVVIPGRVGRFLEDAGHPELAVAWSSPAPEGKLAGLGKLTSSNAGLALIGALAPGEVAGVAVGAGLDAVVYIVPGADASSDGVLLVVGRNDGSRAPVEVHRLPGLHLGSGTPVGRYLDTLAEALAAVGSTQRGETAGRRFDSTPEGEAWAQALDDLGAWCHRTVIGPLIEVTRSWKRNREPRVALIPLGGLGGLPFAAAWTADENLLGGRRYAIHDLVISYAASSRMLFDAARRPRLTTGTVVLATDPDGVFPRARLAAQAIKTNLYPDAVSFGPEPESPASSANVLAALPGDGNREVYLLHFATHGRAERRAADSVLSTTDGGLRVGAIHDHARSRRPDAPGGLVICDACLTDAGLAHHDESLTLATAFLVAGATGVIGTRWPTNDDAAAAFAYRLHSELATGSTPAEALRQTQLSLLGAVEPPPGTPKRLQKPPEDGRWSRPSAWAAYVHHGV